MTHNATGILWGAQGDYGVLKLQGDMRFNVCAPLEYFLKARLPETTVKALIVDVTAVILLDSTILGLLAHIGLAFKERHQRAELVSQSIEMKKLLNSMALDTIFTLTDTPPFGYPPLKALQDPNTSAEDPAECLLCAHQTLSTLSDKNKEAFQGLLELLEKSPASSS